MFEDILRTHYILIYADDVNISGGSVHIIKTNKEVLLVASKETGLEENAEKNECMVMSGDQNVAQNHSITKTAIKSFKGTKQFKHL